MDIFRGDTLTLATDQYDHTTALNQRGLVTSYDDIDWVNIGTGYGLLPWKLQGISWNNVDLYHHQQGSVTFIWGKFHKRFLSHKSLKLAWKWFT